MIGIEYILDLYNITQQNLSDELGIKKQNISYWVGGTRFIPNKYLEFLQRKFSIPKEYLQKEINEKDKLEIQIIKLKNAVNNNINGNGLDEYKLKLEYINYEIRKQELFLKIENSLKESFGDNNNNLDKAMDKLNDYHRLIEEIQ